MFVSSKVSFRKLPKGGGLFFFFLVVTVSNREGRYVVTSTVDIVRYRNTW